MSPQHTILYIEDDPASRLLIQRMLDNAGYRVLLAETGLQGIDIAKSENPDLVLTDINLPDLNGYELTTLLRREEQFDATPIVALTAQGNAAQATAQAAGVTGFLTKPIDIETFIDQVAYYLEGGRDEIDEDDLRNAQIAYTREVVGRLEARIRRLEQANESLKKLDKMKETFIEITAHELRTPLTLIYGYSRLLEENESIRRVAESDPGLLALVGGLTEGIERMQAMIEEILTMSRIMTNQVDLSLSPTNLGDVIATALRRFDDAIKARKLVIHFDPADWPRRMQSDSQLLTLAVSNLLSNAIKYTPDGGDIHLTLHPAEPAMVRFSVRDSGVGIAQEEQDAVFDQFHTTSDASLHSTSKTAFMGGGLGLGLSLSRGVVEAHGGKIWVESAGYDPDNLPGCAFYVSMPLRTERRQYKLKTMNQTEKSS
jgi:signal transduction histidine kinase